MMADYLPKVTAFVTRTCSGRRELLLIQHPNAGIQIPAGTVEEGETFESAVLREVAEETGLHQTSIVQYIGWRDELPPECSHVILTTIKVYSRPDPASFDWASLPRGIGVRALRQQNGFVQVTYEESDQYPNPNTISYQITGWVPEAALAKTNRRHFFHLASADETPQRWQILADNHRFEPFWASLDDLPEIVPPQRAWLNAQPAGWVIHWIEQR